ncbi:MAG: hypothetical protein Tsb0015_11500 [Simkaniaceae bacterium]
MHNQCIFIMIALDVTFFDLKADGTNQQNKFRQKNKEEKCDVADKINKNSFY